MKENTVSRKQGAKCTNVISRRDMDIGITTCLKIFSIFGYIIGLSPTLLSHCTYLAGVRRGFSPKRRTVIHHHQALLFLFLLSTGIFFLVSNCICNGCIRTKSVTSMAYSFYETFPQRIIVVYPVLDVEFCYRDSLQTRLIKRIGLLFSNQENKMYQM